MTLTKESLKIRFMKQRGFAHLLILLIVLAVGAVGVVSYLKSPRPWSIKGPTPIESGTCEKGYTYKGGVCFSNESIGKDTSEIEWSIDTQVEFKIPNGWKKEVTFTKSHNFIKVTSPDYKPSLAFGPEVGAEINISKNKADGKTVEQLLKDESLPYIKNYKERKIAGLDGLCRTVDYEGHHLQCGIVENNELWTFELMTLTNEENKFINDFDSFLDSVVFK